MSLSIARTMSLLFLLPLLFAHRPINVQPRSSVLRRMPMFYGKRDPSVSSSSLSAASIPLLSDAASYQRRLKTGRRYLPQVYDDSTGRIGYYKNSKRTRPESRLEHWNTPRPPIPDYARVFGDVKGSHRSPWALSSVLFEKLQDYSLGDAINERSALPFKRHLARKSQGYQGRPQSYDSQFWKRRDESEDKIGEDYRHGREADVDVDVDAGVVDGQEEPLKSRFEVILEAGSDDRDQGIGTPLALAPIETAEMLPSKLSSVGRDHKKEYVLYAFDDLLGGMTPDVDDDGGDDEDVADATSVRRLYSTESERQNPW